MSLLMFICFILDHIPELVTSETITKPETEPSGYFLFDEETGETHDL